MSRNIKTILWIKEGCGKLPFYNQVPQKIQGEKGEATRTIMTYDIYLPTGIFNEGEGHEYQYASTKILPEIYYHDIEIGAELMDDMVNQIINQLILPKLGNDIISGDMLKITDGARQLRVKVGESVVAIFGDEFIAINFGSGDYKVFNWESPELVNLAVKQGYMNGHKLKENLKGGVDWKGKYVVLRW